MITDVAKYNAGRDNRSYPEIVLPPSGMYQNNLGYEVPKTVHGWEWSTTFGRWSALVTFESGWHGWSYPKTW